MNTTINKLTAILICSAPTALEETFEDARINEDIGFFKNIHCYIIRPLSHFFSSRILRKEILNSIKEITGKTFIDVSAGDDKLPLIIAQNGAKKVLANDISYHAIKPLREKAETNMKFRIGNMLTIKHKKVDWIICKNTLHHLYTIKQWKKAMLKLKELGKNIIIMDVENPMATPLARAWNSYYRFLLKDQGGFFIDYPQFIRTIQVCFPNKQIDFKRIKTIKGYYMLGVIKQE